jgi:1-phosphofructokinase family hexose kinase
MILTVTLNTSIDRTVFIGDFTWNRTIRASQQVVGMGGKAADASWILGELGYTNLAIGFAAGDTGRRMERMLQIRGCKTDFVWVGGETRTNIVVISEVGKGQSTLVTESLEVAELHMRQFEKKFQAALGKARCVLIGGSLPPGLEPSVYTSMVRQAVAAGLPVVLDASGPALKGGMEGHPTVAKPNMDEISDLAGQKVNSIEAAYKIGSIVKKKYGTSVMVITLGQDGALALLSDRAYHIPVLKVPVVSTAGAGDGVTAGLCVALASDKPVEEGLKLGFAAAAAVCLTPATADCRKSDVERLLPKVELIPYPG